MGVEMSSDARASVRGAASLVGWLAWMLALLTLVALTLDVAVKPYDNMASLADDIGCKGAASYVS